MLRSVSLELHKVEKKVNIEEIKGDLLKEGIMCTTKGCRIYSRG